MTLKTLTSGMNTAVAEVVTRPGYLVKIDWTDSVASRLTSFNDVVYSTESYLGRDVQVSITPSDGRGRPSVELQIGNDLQAFGLLVLQYGYTGKRVRVWKGYITGVYPAVTLVPDPVLLFDGEGGRASIDPEYVKLSAAMGRLGAQVCPRLRINAGSGFRTLLPAGTRLTLGAQTFTLERRR